jgi:hypothetical protein
MSCTDHVTSSSSAYESDSFLRNFPIPQIGSFITQTIPLKDTPKIRMIPSSRLPQPAITPENFNYEGTSEQKTKHIRYTLSTQEFKNAISFREQCHILSAHLRSDPVHPEFTFAEIAHILGVPNGESIRKQVQKQLIATKPEGRPSLITKEARAYIGNLIVSRSRKKNPVSLYELGEILRENFNILITVDTLAKYLRRDDTFTTAIGVAMEQKRVFISHTELMQWFDELNLTIHDIPRYFIFNMDETGVDDWVDSHDYLVAIPRQVHSQETNIPVERRSKRATLTACITADGSALKPLVILSTGSIFGEILEAGYTEDKVVFLYQNHGFMTKRLFKYWAQNIFFPYVNLKRAQFAYTGYAILLMDQFSGHEYDIFEEDCIKHHVLTRPLVPHTSHLSQPLDQIIFSIFKQRYSSIRFNKFAVSAGNRIIRILRAWFQTICADLITSTFTAAGIVPDRILYGTVMCCKVDLNRSIHMKHMLPDEIPDDTAAQEPTEEGQMASQMRNQSLSAPASPQKNPVKRHKLLKLENKDTQEKNKKKARSDVDKAHEIDHASPPDPLAKQLTID